MLICEQKMRWKWSRGYQAHLGLGVWSLACRHVFVLLALEVAMVYGVSTAARPPECSWAVEPSLTPAVPEGVHLSCRVRKLNADHLLEGNATLHHVHQVTVLHLKCPRIVVYASELGPGLLTPFSRLQRLNVIGCKLLRLPAGTFLGLRHLRSLTLNSHNEDWAAATLTLEQDSLTGLRQLEYLDISHNALWTIPKNAFCHLTSLSVLNITHNKLNHLPDLSLGGEAVTSGSTQDERDMEPNSCYSNLAHLNLSHNELTDVPEFAFSRAKQLHSLTVSDNKIAKLADWSFAGLPFIRQLDLSNNRIVAVPRNAFLELKELRELFIRNNSLSVLTPAAFSSLEQLYTLDLSHNQISLGQTDVEPFTGLIRLVILDLSFNRFMYLSPEIFRDLYSLQVLNLSNNHISYIAPSTFASLSNLHTLTINSNNLTEVNGKALQGLKVLERLSLDSNQIAFISDVAFDNCSSLHDLSLANNILQQIPSSLSRASSLHTLDLSSNSLEYLEEGDLTGMNRLTGLRLAGNHFTNITKAAFRDVPELRILDLSKNLISSIDPGAFDRTPVLEGVHLNNNRLTNINLLFSNLEKLQWLNVSNNVIDRFDYALIPKDLHWLDISSNVLETLGNYYKLQGQLLLKTLDASSNNIMEISAMSVPNSVEVLFLQKNQIAYIRTNTFLDKYNISHIDLRGNNITKMEEAALRLTPRESDRSLPEVLLAGNPLECDCGADWLQRLTGSSSHHRHNPRLADLPSITCKLPGLWHHAIVPLVVVQSQQFLCTYRRHCFTLCHCCDFDACDCEQMCPRNCTCYHDHTWTTNVMECASANWTRMPSGVPMDVTEAFLDGNFIPALTSHALIGRKNLRVLYLNHSNVDSIQNRTFNGLKALQVLRLDHNKLQVLRGFEFDHLQNLQELYLQYNQISFVSNITFSPIRALEILRLEGNRLSVYPVWNLALNPFLIDVSLHGNPWSCECSFLANFKSWLDANRIKTNDAAEIRCFHNGTGDIGPPILTDAPYICDDYIATTKINNLIIQDYIMLLLITAVMFVVILVVVLFVFVYRKKLRLWMFSKYGKRIFEKSSYVEDKEKLFDAYISYSSKDDAWVCGVLAADLEGGTPAYSLCLSQRDCGSRPYAGQAIMESIACSRRIVLVLSRSFLDTEWCRYEFKSAHVEALRGWRRRIIVIKLEDISRQDVDPELHALLRVSSIISWTDRRFWDKLRLALPSVKKGSGSSHYSSYNGSMRTGKASKPLVTTENNYNTTSWHHPPPPRDTTTKSLNHSNKSLTVNPYWETAISHTIRDEDWQEAKERHRQQQQQLGYEFEWLQQLQTKTPPALPKCPPSPRHHHVRTPSGQVSEGSASHGEDTYMSLSEYGDVTVLPPVESTQRPSAPGSEGVKNVLNITGFAGGDSPKVLPVTSTLSTIVGPTSSSSDSMSPSRVPVTSTASTSRGGAGYFRHDAPDYLTRSWVFHPPTQTAHLTPGSGHTYFV